MDRRSFLKVLGTAALAGYSTASVAEAANPLMGGVLRREAKARIPSMKVIGMGGSGLALMQSMQAGPEALPSHIQADYLAIRFNGRITRGIQSPDLEWTIPLYYHRWREVADDLQKMAAMRQRIPGMERELSEYVKGADIVLLLVSLENAMSFAACDAVAKIARNSGALVVALAGVPYGERLEDVSDESLRIASHDAVNRVLNEADCVIATGGIWGGSTIESVSWDFGYQSSVPNSLLSAAWVASTTGNGFDRLKNILSKSGRAIHGYALGDNAREAIKEAFEEPYTWFDTYGKPIAASSGVIIVSGHPKSVGTCINELRTELARNKPFEISNWVGKPDLLLLAVPCDQLENDQYFFLDIISTGIEFAGEY